MRRFKNKRRKFFKRLRKNLVDPATILEEAKSMEEDLFIQKYKRKKSDIYFSVDLLYPDHILPKLNSHFITLKSLLAIIKTEIDLPKLRKLPSTSFWANTDLTRHSMNKIFQTISLDMANEENLSLDPSIFINLPDREWLCLWLHETFGENPEIIRNNEFNSECFLECMEKDFVSQIIKELGEIPEFLQAYNVNFIAEEHSKLKRLERMLAAIDKIVNDDNLMRFMICNLPKSNSWASINEKTESIKILKRILCQLLNSKNNKIEENEDFSKINITFNSDQTIKQESTAPHN